MHSDTITCRLATTADTASIAALHARSWQETYRGIMPNEFLDEDVADERLTVWQERFSETPVNRRIIVAEAGNELAGFTCVFIDDDPVFGALLDNLHVAGQFKGRGVGRELIRQAAEWVRQQRPDSQFYLWVYEQNPAARWFYEHLGATNHETIRGEFGLVLRYVWPAIQTLVAACARTSSRQNQP